MPDGFAKAPKAQEIIGADDRSDPEAHSANNPCG